MPQERRAARRDNRTRVGCPATSRSHANAPPNARSTSVYAMPLFEDSLVAEGGGAVAPSYFRCLLTAPGP